MQLEKKSFKDFPSEKDLMDIIMHTSSTVWGAELVNKDIENWLSNFKGEVFEIKYERLIALWLLGHFTFYNHTEVTHLCKVLYNDLIHLIVNKNTDPAMQPADLIESFFKKSTIVTSEKISGSGGFIAYFFRHVNELPMTLFNFSIDNISDEKENIIIIDDVTLTADENSQMYKFLKKNFDKYKHKSFYLLTLVSSVTSVSYLQNSFKIEVISAIKLDSRDKCFSSESDIFSTHSDLLIIGREFAEHYGKKFQSLNVGPLGFRDGQYTFGFFYNTPDNTLPIFWAQINGWVPIIRRYHKNYKDRKFLKNERFI
jgi:hypothetical protein